MAAPACVISSEAANAAIDAKSIHSIPCKLSYDGPAQVSGYFTIQNLASGGAKASFRGHGLQGISLGVPSGYELSVLKKRGNETYNVETKQSSFMLWEWDREAGSRSTTARALSQLRIAKALAEV